MSDLNLTGIAFEFADDGSAVNVLLRFADGRVIAFPLAYEAMSTVVTQFQEAHARAAGLWAAKHGAAPPPSAPTPISEITLAAAEQNGQPVAILQVHTGSAASHDLSLGLSLARGLSEQLAELVRTLSAGPGSKRH